MESEDVLCKQAGHFFGTISSPAGDVVTELGKAVYDYEDGVEPLAGRQVSYEIHSNVVPSTVGCR